MTNTQSVRDGDAFLNLLVPAIKLDEVNLKEMIADARRNWRRFQQRDVELVSTGAAESAADRRMSTA